MAESDRIEIGGFIRTPLPLVIRWQWSNKGLWWTDIKDGSRLWHVAHWGIIERTLDDGITYKGLQVILLWLAVSIALVPRR